MADPITQFVISLAVNVAFNALFPPTVEQPRTTQLRLQRSDYGIYIPKAWGPRNRLAGNVIWSSGLQERKSKKSSKGKGKTRVISYSYSTSVAILLADGQTAGIRRIWANSKLLFDLDSYSGPSSGPTADYHLHVGGTGFKGYPFANLWVYSGTATQTANSVIQADLGVDETPGFRHSTYVVIDSLQLADFGNVLPMLEFEVVGDEEITIGEIVQEIAQTCGVSDVSGIGGTPDCQGYTVNNAPTGWDGVKPLLAAFGYDLADQGGDLRLIQRGLGMADVIPLEELGVMPWPRDPGDVVMRERIDDIDLPREASIVYPDYARDLQNNSVSARRQIGSAESKLALELTIPLSNDEARTIADRALFEQGASRRKIEFSGSRRHDHIMAGKCYGIPTPTRPFAPYRITRKRESPNGVIEFAAIAEDPEIYNSSAPGAGAPILPNPVQVPGDTTLVIIDAPMLDVGDDNTGFYWGACGDSSAWRGGVILRSSDGGSTYTQMAEVGVPAVLGDVATAAPAAAVDVWDRASVITVVLVNEEDELESLDESLVLNGANACWIGPADGQGGEILQFATATLTAPGTYQLTNLLRGRRGTDHAVATHGPNEKFMLIEPDSLNDQDFGNTDWNKERDYKPVSLLLDEADATAQQFTNTGERKRPFSPVHIIGSRDSSNNLDISWIRRTRVSAPGLGEGPIPIGENNGLVFAVEIYDGPTLVRTKTATFLSSYTGTLSLSNCDAGIYTAAEQTSDGLTPGDPVDVVIYQQSDYVTDGRPRSATV